ncbi:MAG TPA: AbrB/MazE/SpoVT family DNA-binding domain-containing protein [Ktedonobacterales bacterium]|nr:AbrB/MazE/SpoVT family DNA-binding domain-containing protein [Ktedonobacterales bacterium]
MVGAKRHVRIAAQGQIALPADFLRKHRLKAGDEVALEETDQGVLITREEPMHEEQEPHHQTPASADLARRRRTAAALAVVARTAGALQSDIPFPGIDAERAAAEAAMAEDARRER